MTVPGAARLVIVGPTYPFRGGIAQYTSQLARHLRRRRPVTLISFSRGYPRLLYPGQTDRDPSPPAAQAAAEYLLSPWSPFSWRLTARRIRALKPAVAIIQWWVPFWAPSLAAVAALTRRSRGPRVVFVCHNVMPHEGAGVPTRALTRLALAQGDGFVVHSRADAAALEEVVTDPLVERSVLPALMTLPAVDRATARRQLGLPAEAQVALFFGFVRPYKGLEQLLAALPSAAEALGDLHLIVAGEFWGSVARSRRLAEELGVGRRVHFIDRYLVDEEAAAVFAAADIVVLPYLQASQSAIVPLAVEAGMPVIATRVGGLVDVVTEGVTGLLVPPADPAALAAALIRALGEPRLLERLRTGSTARRPFFAWDRHVDRVEALVARLARRGSGAPAPGSAAAGPRGERFP